jgi:hypothetical protein
MLRKFKNSAGETILEIPSEHMCCPKCGAGDLISVDDRDVLDGDPFYSDEVLECTHVDPDTLDRCEWSGTARTIYNRAVKKESLVPCPCCRGTGMIHKDKVKDHKER